MMRWKTWWAGLLLVAVAGLCFAQSVTAAPELKDADGVVNFSGPWRFHPGDDAAWAEAGFDDSLWLQVTSEETLAAQGIEGFHGFGWYRIRVKVPVSSGSLAVALPDIASSYVVYADGQEVGHFGGMPPRPEIFFSQPKMFALPAVVGAKGEVTLAIRLGVDGREKNPGFGDGVTTVGAPPAVKVVWEHSRDRELVFPEIQFWLASLFDLLVTVGMLGLWLVQRDRREYLMLTLANGIGIVGSVLAFGAVYGRLPAKWEQFGSNAAWYVALIFAIEFVFSFVQVKPWRIVRILQAVQATFAVVALIGLMTGWVPIWLANAGQEPISFALAILTFAVLFPQWRAGSEEAGVILLAAVVYFLGLSVDFIGEIAAKLGLWHPGHGLATPGILPVFHLGEIPISSATILDILLDLAFFVIVLVRHTRVSRERERTQSELAAARTVQQVMLPEPVTMVPGFTVEVEYLPASEVGGDFYQVMKTPDGGLLLVTGDVSGKGMPAAMVVALLVGAIRTEAAHTTDPAMLLKVLNARVNGRIRNGFATCAALYLRADGLAMLANAANPAPYLNGEEVEVDGALPLGLIPEIDYSTRAFWMESGDALTFVSDGVVEAVKDRELFGFERTRELSKKGAKAIAEAARAFGQVDDITVLTVRRD
jgi:hypothetical protein